MADVSSADSAAIEPVLRRLVDGEIIPTVNGFHVVATLSGESARDLNRSLLSDLRHVERRTRLRSAWTLDGVTEVGALDRSHLETLEKSLFASRFLMDRPSGEAISSAPARSEPLSPPSDSFSAQPASG